MDKPTFKIINGCWEIYMPDGKSFSYVNGEMIPFIGNIEKQFDKKVICGKCGKEVLQTNIKTPQPISEWDKKNNSTRDHAFNCCGRNWLIGDLEPMDCGPALEEA